MKTIESGFVFEGESYADECHAATITVLNDNTVIVAWFSGTAEGKNDVSIWCRRRISGMWEIPFRVSEDDGVPHWNPVLFSQDGNEVTLFYKSGNRISDWKTFVMKSFDSGKSWSSAVELVPGDISGGRGPVKNKPIVTSNGRLLAPASVERDKWRCFIDIFEHDEWKKHTIPVRHEEDNDLAIIQPTLWEDKSGSVHALMRSNRGRIYRSDSEDFGDTWTECYPTDIPNNNSGIDLVKLGETLVLVCNPVGNNWGVRTPLTLFVSSDNGASFSKVTDIEKNYGEFSYPSIVTKGKRLYLVYTWKRKKISFCEFLLEFKSKG